MIQRPHSKEGPLFRKEVFGEKLAINGSSTLYCRGYQLARMVTFLCTPRRPICAHVREFYANITSPEPASMTVTGVEVLFSTTAINTIFGLDDADDEYILFSENITDE